MDDSRYYDLQRPDDGWEKTGYFVLDSLLKSRIECGFESSAKRHDENTNVYLVHLLSSLVGPSSVGDQTARCDIDVFDKVKESTDPRHKFSVYRANADHLLLSAGIFTDSPYVETEGRRLYDDPTRNRIGRGKAYYHYASMFHGRIHSSSPVVSDVLGYLSENFERFVDVLFHMRGEYFNLYERLKEDHFMSLQEPVTPGSGSSDLASLRDDFLDAYWVWHQNPDVASRNALIESVKRLRAADSTFDFQLPEQ